MSSETLLRDSRPVSLDGPSFPRAHDWQREAAVRVARDRARLHLYAVERMLSAVDAELATAACVLAEVDDRENFLLIPATAHALAEQVRAAMKELE